ncbi:kinase-like protein, partial [Rhizophagus irregularis]
MDLRKYLQQNHNQLTWKERINIAYEIIRSLSYIHDEKAIHRDLHSGNILYLQLNNSWRMSDLGFCGPADKSSKCIYGNLPYIAPEVIIGREYTFASDIYSIAMLMWEISSGKPPFINYEHENEIVMNIINGIRPKIVPGTPLEYKNLMIQCWNADPLKRPDVYVIEDKMAKINLCYQNMPDESLQSEINKNKFSNIETNYTSSRLFTSKIHNFENLPEPRNATEGEQEAFHSKLYDFNIPNNINDFNGSNKQYSDSEKLPKEFINLQINSNKIIQQDEKEIIQQKMKRQNIGDIDDDDKVYN